MDDADRTWCEPGEWLPTLRRWKQDGYTFFDFLTAVDQSDAAEVPGFDVVTHLYRLAEHLGEVFVQTRLPDGAALASLTPLWRGAAWHERETWEMFGIDFDGFDDGTGRGLRPLLLPDGFEGTPLRKSFVLAARVSKPWPGAKDPSDRQTGADESAAKRRPGRRMLPPGIPPQSWGPR